MPIHIILVTIYAPKVSHCAKCHDYPLKQTHVHNHATHKGHLGEQTWLQLLFATKARYVLGAYYIERTPRLV